MTHAIDAATGGAANSRLTVVPIAATGVEADDVLNNSDTLADVVAGATNEATGTGWTRKEIPKASVTVTVNDTTNLVDVDIPDQTWTAVSATSVSDLVVAYDADNTTGTDANIIPLTFHDFAITPDGSDVTAQIATAGFYRAQ